MDSAETRLVRGIGRWDLVGILVNAVVGAGIFALPAKLFALIGSFSVLAWVAGAALVGLIALCFAEVSSRFDKTGGPYLYTLTAFGPKAGYLIGWIGWVSRLLAYASVCNLSVDYAAAFYGPLSAGLPHALATSLITVALTLVVLRGVRFSAHANNAFTIVKLAVLLSLVVVGLMHLDPARFSFAPVPRPGQAQSAILLMLFAFLGFEGATVNGGEMRNPRRDAPFALGVGLAGVAILYVLVQAVCIGTVPDLAVSTRPIADGAIRVLGPIGGGIATFGAVVSMLGTLTVLLIASPRVPFAMAEHGQLPKVFAAIHPRFRTPHIAILAHGGLAWLLTETGSVVGALTISTLTRLITYVATCAALLMLRQRPGTAAKARFAAPAGATVAAVAIAASLWLMLGTTRQEAMSFVAIVLLGALIAGTYAFRRRWGIADS